MHMYTITLQWYIVFRRCPFFSNYYCLSHDSLGCAVATNELPDISDFMHEVHFSFMLSAQLTVAECLLRIVSQGPGLMGSSPRKMFWVLKQERRSYMEFSCHLPILWHGNDIQYFHSEPLARASERELGNWGQYTK